MGQDEAIEKIVKSIMRSKTGIGNPNRPLGSFLFL
jgi:ATP-dependent Clp protease ATP-binding subunit ClpC